MSQLGRVDVDAAVAHCEDVVSRLKAHLPPATTASLPSNSSKDVAATAAQTSALLTEVYSCLHDVLVKLPEQFHWRPLHECLSECKLPPVDAALSDIPVYTCLPRQFFSLVPLVRYAHHVAKATQNEQLSVCIAAPLLTLALGIAYGRVLSSKALSDYYRTESARVWLPHVDAKVNDTLGSLAIIASLVAPTLLPEYGMRNPTSAPDSDTTPDATTAPEYPLPLWVPVALAQLFELSTLMQWAVAAKTRALRTVKSDEEQIAAALANKSAPAPVSHDKDEFAPALFLLEKAHDVWRYLPAAFTPTAADAMEARLRVASADASVVAALPVPLSPVPLPFTPFQPHHLPETALHALAAAAAARDRARAQAEAKSEAVEGQQEAEADAAVKEHAQLSVDTDVWTSCPPAGLYLYALLSLLCVPATLSLFTALVHEASISAVTPHTHISAEDDAVYRRWVLRRAYVTQALTHTPLSFFLAHQAHSYLRHSGASLLREEVDDENTGLQAHIAAYRKHSEKLAEHRKNMTLRKGKSNMDVLREAEKHIEQLRNALVVTPTIHMVVRARPPLLAFLSNTTAVLFSRTSAAVLPARVHEEHAPTLPLWSARPLHHITRVRHHTATAYGVKTSRDVGALAAAVTINARPETEANAEAATETGEPLEEDTYCMPQDFLTEDNMAALKMSSLASTDRILSSPEPGHSDTVHASSGTTPDDDVDAHESLRVERQNRCESLAWGFCLLRQCLPYLAVVSTDTLSLLGLSWAHFASSCRRDKVNMQNMPIDPDRNPFRSPEDVASMLQEVARHARMPFSRSVGAKSPVSQEYTTTIHHMATDIGAAVHSAVMPLQSVANPLNNLAFVPVPPLCSSQPVHLATSFINPIQDANMLPLSLILLMEPAAGAWVCAPWRPATLLSYIRPHLTNLLACAGYAHLSRGAWACVEERIHAQLTQPLQPAEDVRARDAMGLAASRTHTHAQLPLYAVPEVLRWSLLRMHSHNSSFADYDTAQPHTVLTMPLLAFAPTAALVPPLLALLSASALKDSPLVYLQTGLGNVLSSIATAAANEEDLGEVRHLNPATCEPVAFSSSVLCHSSIPGLSYYCDPVITAISSNESKIDTISHAETALREALATVGAASLASAAAPRLSSDEGKRLRIWAKALDVDAELPFSHMDLSSVARSPSDDGGAAPLLDAVKALNTPAVPCDLQFKAAPGPACPRCQGLQVPALTFVTVHAAARREARGVAGQGKKTRGDSGGAAASDDEPGLFSYASYTCLTCFPSSLQFATWARSMLLVESGAVVTIAGANASHIQMDALAKLQQQSLPKLKTQKGALKPLPHTNILANLMPSTSPLRDALATSTALSDTPQSGTALRLCLRYVALSSPPSDVKYSMPPFGQSALAWAKTWQHHFQHRFDIRRHGLDRAHPLRAVLYTRVAGVPGALHHHAQLAVVPPAALSLSFPSEGMASLPHIRLRAAVAHIALRGTQFLSWLAPQVAAMLHCRDTLAHLLLCCPSVTISEGTHATSAGGDVDDELTYDNHVATSSLSFSMLSLHALAGCTPEYALIQNDLVDSLEEADADQLFAPTTSPLISYLAQPCKCGLDLPAEEEAGVDVRGSDDENADAQALTLPATSSRTRTPYASCPKHGPWFSAMPSLLRSVSSSSILKRFLTLPHSSPTTITPDGKAALEFCNTILSTPNLPAAISLSLLAHALRVCAAMVPNIIACLAAPARASALVLRTVAALNALNAALPATVFGPGGRPQPLRVDMLAAAMPVEMLIGRELECLKTALTVVQRIVATHTLEAQAEAEAKAKAGAEAEAKAGTDAAAVGAPEVNAEPAPETQEEAAAKAAVSARPAAAGAVPVSGALLPEPLLHCAATLAQSLPLVVLATFFGALSNTAAKVSEALEACAAALVPLDSFATATTINTALLHALQRTMPSDGHALAPVLYELILEGETRSAEDRERDLTILASPDGYATILHDIMITCFDACTHHVVFSAAMHAEQHLRLVLTPHVHVPARVLAEQHTPQTPAAAQVRVVNELHDTVVCHVTPSMAVDIVPTAPRAVPVATLCAWLDHLRLACCRTHEAAAAISAKPAATLVAAAAPEADTGAEATKAEAEGVAVAAPQSAPADAWQCVWDWLLSVRRAHVHTLAREYATHGAAQVLLRRLPPPARASMACYDTLPHTPPADVSELSATEVPTLSQVPVHAQTWVLLCTRMWNDAAQQWARSVALGALCQLAPGLRGRTSEAIAAAAARQPACFDAFMRSSAHKTFAALAVAAGLRGVRVPGLMAQAARASTKWQGAYDPLLFPCPSAAPHVRAVSADAVFAPTHATLRDRTMDVSRYTVSVSLPCVPEYTPVPVPEWQQAKPAMIEASQAMQQALGSSKTISATPFKHTLLAKFVEDIVRLSTSDQVRGRSTAPTQTDDSDEDGDDEGESVERIPELELETVSDFQTNEDPDFDSYYSMPPAAYTEEDIVQQLTSFASRPNGLPNDDPPSPISHADMLSMYAPGSIPHTDRYGYESEDDTADYAAYNQVD